MVKALLLALVALPFVELSLLWLIGEHIGFWPTVGMVFGVGLIGTALARREGMRVFRRWQEALARRQVPEEGLLGGMLVFAAGVLLAIPGVLSDVLGLLLLLPPTRRFVAKQVRQRVERGMASGTVRVTTFRGGSPGSPVSPPPRPHLERGPGGEVDAEFTDEGAGRG